MDIRQSKLSQQWTDLLNGESVQKSVKTYQQAKGFFASKDINIADTTSMYEVYSSLSNGQAGQLNWGLTILHPVYVNEECNMTRGHFHEQLHCEEYYWCMQGNGLLMLMDQAGKCWCEKVEEGSLHHIQSNLAHRLINTGDTDLKVIACWPADAGHDYEKIEAMPFPYRIYKKKDEIRIEEREYE